MIARLALIGLVAGVFSAGFGGGGGVVVVPLPVSPRGVPTHAAAATPPRAVRLNAAAGALLYAARGEVRWGYALLIGLPAVVGAVAGTHVQQRLSGHALTVAFAALLAVIGIRLVVL